MKRLWTPWRMAYLRAPKGSVTGGCIFCDKVQGPVENDRENLVLLRGKHAFLMLNLYPYANGHMLVVPYQHSGELEALDPDALQEMMLLVNRAIQALRTVMAPQGFNVGANLGRAAGAGVDDHVHFHVVPRWVGDTNFMPVLSDVRMIPEMLPQTYDQLHKALIAQDKEDKAG
jgi:ATP adenylyltransferase